MSSAAMPALRNIIRAATYAQLCCMQHIWAHARRDFVDATVGRPQFGKWSRRWLERIAALYRDNAERARRWDPGLPVGRQGAAFAKAQRRLERGADALFGQARRALAALPADAPQGKPPRALERHREGLTAFLRDPAVPLDNNAAHADNRIMPRSGSKSLIQRGAELKFSGIIRRVVGS